MVRERVVPKGGWPPGGVKHPILAWCLEWELLWELLEGASGNADRKDVV